MKSHFHQKLFLCLILLGLIFYFLGALADSSSATYLSLNQEEYDWLAQHQSAKVAVSQDYAPISFINDDGKHVGIAADMLARIELQLKQINSSFKFETAVPTASQQSSNDPKDKKKTWWWILSIHLIAKNIGIFPNHI